MAKLNLSQAAKAVGKNRTTIWRHINSGKLSYERDRDGMPFVDTSELIRVYGELKQGATPDAKETQHQATPSYSELIGVVEKLRAEQVEMKKQISELSNRLTYSPKLEELTTQNKSPEDDPEWPKEIVTMADIAIRNEIKDRYKG